MAKKFDSSAGPGGSGTAKITRTSRPKTAGGVKKVAAPKAMAAVASAGGPAVYTRSEQDEIAHLAYGYWLQRGGKGGTPEEDWLRAEKELRQHQSASHGSNGSNGS
jgi:hypothetical protein